MKLLHNEKEYRSYPGLNYSKLKLLEGDPEKILSEDKLFNDGILYGGAIDTLIFDGRNVFDEKYYISSAQKPTASLGDLADAYVEASYSNKTTKIRDEKLALDLISSLGIWSNIKKEETLLKKLTDEFWSYIYDVFVAGDRLVISNESYQTMCDAMSALKHNSFTSPYFHKQGADNSKIQHLYQLPIVFQYRGNIEMKALLDILMIDHVNKEITPVDLKTLDASIYFFPVNVSKFRYDLQAEIYNKAVEAYRDEKFPDYKIKPFKYIVSSSQKPEKPIVYSIDPTDWRMRVNATRTKKLRGLMELTTDFIWHSETQQFEYPKAYYDKGYLEL